MIDGIASRAFSATTIDTPPRLPESNRPAVIAYSQTHYAADSAVVEQQIIDWHEPIVPAAAYEEPSRPSRQEFSQSPRREFERPAPRASTPSASSLPLRPVSPRPSTATSALPRPVSLNEAVQRGPVDFRGRPVASQSRPGTPSPRASTTPSAAPRPVVPKAKADVDVQGLRDILNEVTKK